jgi:putative FmdB family regulatory protein
VPLYEFVCRKCGHRFEELVGAHVGRDEAGVACPQCGAKDPERLVSAYAPLQHTMTAGEKRRSEAKRGIDRGGAKERFRKQRAAERARSGRRGG